MKFINRELHGSVLRMNENTIVKKIIVTDERIAVKLNYGSIVEYIFAPKPKRV